MIFIYELHCFVILYDAGASITLAM